MKHLVSIQKNEDGTAAIEFAFVAPMLFLLIMGIVELGLVMFANNVIENATVIGARYGITGSDYAGEARVRSGDDRLDVIKKTIQSRSGGLLDEDNIRIYCESLGANFGTASRNRVNGRDDAEAPGDDSCTSANLGAGDAAVIYNVTYRWELFTPLIGEFFTDNTLLIESAMVVKNESFGALGAGE